MPASAAYSGVMTSGGRTAEIAAEIAESYEIASSGHHQHGLVLLCDHASNRLPSEYGTLGLPSSELDRHIAYDIGIAGVTRYVSESLGAPAALTRHSRLLIDPNRGDDDPTLIMRLSDGAIIPGNRYLDDVERERRITRFYRPYHTAIRRLTAAIEANGRTPILLGMHSFTHVWKGMRRPWDCGVLWHDDARFSGPLLTALRAEPGLVVGDNQPYPGQYEGDTLWQHGTIPGHPFCSIEIRQDLIADEAGQRAWAARLARLLPPILAKLP